MLELVGGTDGTSGGMATLKSIISYVINPRFLKNISWTGRGKGDERKIPLQRYVHTVDFITVLGVKADHTLTRRQVQKAFTYTLCKHPPRSPSKKKKNPASKENDKTVRDGSNETVRDENNEVLETASIAIESSSYASSSPSTSPPPKSLSPSPRTEKTNSSHEMIVVQKAIMKPFPQQQFIKQQFVPQQFMPYNMPSQQPFFNMHTPYNYNQFH